MDQPYSAVADLLNKFHALPMAIQALCFIAVPFTVLGMTWLVMRGLRDIASAMRRPRLEPPKSLLVYGVVQDPNGRWFVIHTGRAPEPVDWRNPPELLGRQTKLN